MRRSDRWIQKFFDSKADSSSSTDLGINGRNGGVYSSDELYALLSKKISEQILLSDEENLLEVGCGTGRIYSELAIRLSHCAAVDLSLEMLKIAQSRGAANLIQSYGDQLPFKNESFSRAICCGVLTNIKDDKIIDGIITELFRVIRRGGYFLIGDIPDIEIINFNSSWQPVSRPIDLVKNILRSMPGFAHVSSFIYKCIGKGIRPYYRSFHKDEFVALGAKLGLQVQVVASPISEMHFDVICHKPL